jgi:TonB family protein
MSDVGSLSGCILENDPETQGRARMLRGKALAVSLTFEAALWAAVWVWPLIVPGVLSGRFTVTPVPPYSSGESLGNKQPRNDDHRAPAKSETPHPCLFCAQSVAPARPQTSGDGRETTSDGPVLGSGFDSSANQDGPLIPGGDVNSRTSIEIKKPELPQRVGPQHMNEGVMEAALIRKVQPEYPALARIAHVSGTVRLRAIIGTDGKIRELEVINGNSFLQAAAVAAVRGWRYRPTLLNGQPVEVETLITVNFVLD